MQLYAILRDTAQMGLIEEEPELAIDLRLRIADNYKNSPDLRFVIKSLSSLMYLHIYGF